MMHGEQDALAIGTIAEICVVRYYSNFLGEINNEE